MKSQDNEDDCLDDPIQLHFEANAPLIDNYQFLDPGIIDLDCYSDEDCKYIEENTADINLLGGAKKQSVTIAKFNRVDTKPMCIKLVDCYKFPWYFDQATKDIIEKKLVFNNSINLSINKQMISDSPKKLKNVSDECKVDSNSLSMSVNNNSINEGLINVNIDVFKNNTDTYTNKTIDMKRVHETFSTNRVFDNSKRLANSKIRNDMEILKALSERNKTEVDLKKNKGLVGMKIQRITSERQTMKIMYNTKKQTENNNGKNDQETLHKLYVQAVDTALVDLGTTITPVFDGATENTKESEPSKYAPQGVNVTSNVREFSSFTSNLKIPATLDSDENGEDLKYISAQKDDKKDISTKINVTKKIAQEIVRMMTSQNKQKFSNKERNNKNKFGKPMPYSKKIESERKKILMDGIQTSLKQQKITEGCKMTKMIIPIPLSSKARKKMKSNSIKQQNRNICDPKESKSPNITFSSQPQTNTIDVTTNTKLYEVKDAQKETGNVNTQKGIPTNSISPTQRLDAYTPNKTFTTLNKFTENILNKIQARQLQQSKNDKPDKFHEKRYKKAQYCVDQSKSTSENKSMANETITKDTVNTSSNDTLDSKRDNPAEKICDVMNSTNSTSPAQLKFSKNKPNCLPNKSYTEKHLNFPHNNVTNTLPLNTIVMKTAKTDKATIDEISRSTLVENTHSNKTNYNNPVNQCNTNTEQISSVNSTGAIETQKQVSNAMSVKGIKNYDTKNKEELKRIPVSAHKSSESIATETVKDKFTIQTIITHQNGVDNDKHSSSHTASNSTVYTHIPKTQVSAFIIKPSQAQNYQTQLKKNSLTVHNSMQSHILYRPQTEYQQNSQMFPNNSEPLRNHTLAQPINHSAIVPDCATWYSEGVAHTAMNARSSTGDLPASMISKTILPSDGIRGVTPQTATIHLGDISTQITVNARSMPSGVSGFISSQSRIKARPVSNSRSNPPYRAMNDRPQFHQRVNGAMSQQTGMNARPLRVNGSILPYMLPGDNGGTPQQFAMSKRSAPPGICDVQPSTVFWSYAYPPPNKPPPPPLFPPIFQETTGSPSSYDHGTPYISHTIDNSIIGRNNDGIIKKICINAPVPVVDCNTKERMVKIKNDEADSTPLYDEVSSDVLTDATLVTTKSEMLRVLDTSMYQIQSPVEHLQGTFSTVSSHSPAKHSKSNQPLKSSTGPIDLKNSLPRQSKERSVNVTKPGLSQPKVKPKKISATNWKVPSACELNFNVDNLKRMMPVVPNSSRAIQSKELKNKYNQSSVTNPSEVPPFKRLIEVNSKPSDMANITKTNETNLSHITHSKPFKPKEVSVSNNKREQRNFENNESLFSSSKRTDTASPVNLKRALPINETKYVSPTVQTKYKPGPLSKKMKSRDPRGSPNHTKTKEKTLPSKGCSYPITPIPKYGLNIFGIPNDIKPFDHIMKQNKTKKQKHFESSSSKVDSSKKISIDEYKKRSASERKTDEKDMVNNSKQKETFKSNTVVMPRRESYVDSDLGYDSDTTVKL